jgi:signal transduction histidine kinase
VSVLGCLIGASSGQRSPGRQAAAWTAAVAGPLLIAVASIPLRSDFGLAGGLFCTLLIVVAVTPIGGVPPAVATVVVGVLAGAYFLAPPFNSLRLNRAGDIVALVIFALVGVIAATLVDELLRLAEQQATRQRVDAALRRVATLVARAVPAEELFAAVTEEVGQLLPVDFAAMGRYESDGTMTTVGGWGKTAMMFPVGVRKSLGGSNVSTLVAQTGAPARMDSYAAGSGAVGAVARETGVHSSVGTPILVGGRLWGVMIVASIEDPLSLDTESRLGDFTELLATAIANAESRAEIAASRARIVAAADETRRQIERDLHDGAQQRLVSLGLGLRAAQASVPPALGELGGELSRVAEGLAGVQDELREFARGIHPAILAEGGLGPALSTLARRSGIPVELDVHMQSRLPERVEVATYYVVSEALTNAVKHAGAELVHVELETVDSVLRFSVSDDGAGGADPTAGSGLIGLKDRVEALGGTITLHSPLGGGTSLIVELALGD